MILLLIKQITNWNNYSPYSHIITEEYNILYGLLWPWQQLAFLLPLFYVLFTSFFASFFWMKLFCDPSLRPLNSKSVQLDLSPDFDVLNPSVPVLQIPLKYAWCHCLVGVQPNQFPYRRVSMSHQYVVVDLFIYDIVDFTNLLISRNFPEIFWTVNLKITITYG